MSIDLGAIWQAFLSVMQFLAPLLIPAASSVIGARNAEAKRIEAEAKQDEIDAKKDETLVRTNDELWRRLRAVEDERELLKQQMKEEREILQGSIAVLAGEVEVLRKSNIPPSELTALREKLAHQDQRIEAMQAEIDQLKADNLAKSNENTSLRIKLEEAEKSNQVLKIENNALNRVLVARNEAQG